MRLDKYISNLGYGSRKQVMQYIKDGYIGINGETVYEKDANIHFGDILNIGEENIEYKEFIYLILHKPVGYISSKKSEGGHESYLELLQTCPYKNIIDIVGRLDFDSSGLLLLTNNGDLTHKLLHPKKEIFKKYLVTGIRSLTDKDKQKLEKGVKIDSDISAPAKVESINENEIFLSISEGRFHQIKKMYEAIGNQVVSLKRLSIGSIELGDLNIGDWRYLTENEIEKLYMIG